VRFLPAKGAVVSDADLFSLDGKVALVTGGSRGLGRAMVDGFARAGADVVVASRNLDSCRRAAEEVERTHGRRALPVSCHVGRWNELDALVATAYDAFGHVDVLVNNAGLSPRYESLPAVTEELWDKVYAVCVKGPFRLSVLVAERMVAGDGGSIVNISTTGAVDPHPWGVPYHAAKAGLNNMTVALARAYGPKVRVNCIMPGAFATDITKQWDMAAFEVTAEQVLALGRIGQPEEIVGAALYFASNASSYTTGSVLAVEGGYGGAPQP
jgi:NAD(P)-dependent dehydrogenase (short-subunit alcohol dehydrogenase family)